MARFKGVLTTGQVARICHVAPRTVAKWFDHGALKGYRVPGSKDRRIPMSDLVRFMRAYGMPLDGVDTGNVRILIVDPNRQHREALARTLGQGIFYEVQAAESPFAAGIAAARFEPHVILVAPRTPELRRTVPDDQQSLGKTVGGFKLVAIASDASEADELRRHGYDDCLIRPLKLKDVIQTIDAVLGFDTSSSS